MIDQAVINTFAVGVFGLREGDRIEPVFHLLSLLIEGCRVEGVEWFVEREGVLKQRHHRLNSRVDSGLQKFFAQGVQVAQQIRQALLLVRFQTPLRRIKVGDQDALESLAEHALNHC